MTQAQAEAIVRSVADADTSDLATKADIAATKTDIAALSAATKADIVATKAEIAQVKHDLTVLITETKAELFRFLYLQAIGIIGLTVALIKLLP